MITFLSQKSRDIARLTGKIGKEISVELSLIGHSKMSRIGGGLPKAVADGGSTLVIIRFRLALHAVVL